MSQWKTPRFIEIPMNAEIGGYSDQLAEVDTLPSEPDPVPAGDPPELLDLVSVTALPQLDP